MRASSPLPMSRPLRSMLFLTLALAAGSSAAQTFSFGGTTCTQTERDATATVCVEVPGGAPICAEYQTTRFEVSCSPGGSTGFDGGLGGIPGLDGIGGTGVGETAVDEPKTGCDETTSRPVMIATGNKVQPEMDFMLPTTGVPLGIMRNYSKAMSGGGIFGNKWVSNIDLSLTFVGAAGVTCAGRLDTAVACTPDPATISKILAVRGGTGGASYEPANDLWVNADDGSSIARVGGQWVLTQANGSTETYNAKGQPVAVRDVRGVGNQYAYNGSGQLASVTHSSGRSIGFTWSAGRVSTVTAPNGKTYAYGYTGGYLSSVTSPDNLGVRTYHYEDGAQPGGLTGITVNGVRHSRYSYYADGRVKKSGLGNNGDFDSSAFTYGSNFVNVTNALGQTVKYLTHELDGAKRVIGVERPVSAACPVGTARYTQFGADGNVDYTLDGYGVKTDYEYDAKDQLTRRTAGIGPNGETDQQQLTKYVWDPAKKGRLLAVKVFGESTDVGQRFVETTYAYYPVGDARANLLQSVTVRNLSTQGVTNSTRVTSYNYTLHANKLIATMTVNGPLAGSGDAITYTYSTTGDLLSIRNSLNHTVSNSNYNGLGLPGRVVGANGAITDFTYDARGRVLTRTEHVNGTTATTTFEYDAHGQPKKVTHPDGKVYQYGYSVHGKPSSVITTRPAELIEQLNNADGLVTELSAIVYNNSGAPTAYLTEKRWNEIQMTCNPFCELPGEPIGPGDGEVVPKSELVRRENIQYDPSGFVRSVTGNGGQNVRYTYDANGNVKTITDSLNQVTTLTYDRHQNVTRSVGPLGQTTSYLYDRIGRLVRVTDPRGKATNYVYDGFGQLLSQGSPDTGTTLFDYSAGGQRTSMTRNSGAVTSFGYDALGRLTSASSGGQVQSFSFDTCANGKGRLCQVGDPTGTITYAYTPQGQLAIQHSAMPAGGSAQYTYAYDTLGRLTQVGYPDGVGVGYAYAHGRLRTVTATIGGVTHNVVTQLRHQPFGRAADWTWGNGLRREARYDLDGRLTELSTRNGATYLQRQGYLYTANDNISSITNQVNAGLSQSFGYDGLSRLATVTASGANQAFTWDANGNRVNHTWGGLTDNYSTDVNGNRLNAITGPRATAFTYDANGNTLSGEGASFTYSPFNRLTTATKGGVTTTYAVNALGQRVHKKVGAAANQWFTYGPGGQLMGEFQSTWSHYVWMGGTPVARIKSGQLHLIHSDHLGRPEFVTNSAKSVVWRANNYAFDRTVTQNSIGGLNLGFPGQYWDAETGYWYNISRTYNARIGRYLESDPIGLAGGLNSYAYVGGNPLTFVDPLGLDACTCRSTQTKDEQLGGIYAPKARAISGSEAQGLTTAWNTRDNSYYAAGSVVTGLLAMVPTPATPYLSGLSMVISVAGIASSPDNYAAAGDVHESSFYDHGDHLQRVNVISRNGEIIKVEVNEICGD